MRFIRSKDSILGMMRRKIIADENVTNGGYYRWVNVGDIIDVYGNNHTHSQIKYHFNKLVETGDLATKLTTSAHRLYSLPAIEGYTLDGNYFNLTTIPKP